MTTHEIDLIAYALYEARQVSKMGLGGSGIRVSMDSIARALQGNEIAFDRARFEAICLKGVPE